VTSLDVSGQSEIIGFGAHKLNWNWLFSFYFSFLEWIGRSFCGLSSYLPPSRPRLGACLGQKRVCIKRICREFSYCLFIYECLVEKTLEIDLSATHKFGMQQKYLLASRLVGISNSREEYNESCSRKCLTGI